jgi:hypothetical protein
LGPQPGTAAVGIVKCIDDPTQIEKTFRFFVCNDD